MRAWGVVNNELNDMSKFSNLVWETLHDVLHQHAHDLLSFFVLGLDEALLHGSPGSTESMSESNH